MTHEISRREALKTIGLASVGLVTAAAFFSSARGGQDYLPLLKTNRELINSPEVYTSELNMLLDRVKPRERTIAFSDDFLRGIDPELFFNTSLITLDRLIQSHEEFRQAHRIDLPFFADIKNISFELIDSPFIGGLVTPTKNSDGTYSITYALKRNTIPGIMAHETAHLITTGMVRRMGIPIYQERLISELFSEVCQLDTLVNGNKSNYQYPYTPEQIDYEIKGLLGLHGYSYVHPGEKVFPESLTHKQLVHFHYPEIQGNTEFFFVFPSILASEIAVRAFSNSGPDDPDASRVLTSLFEFVGAARDRNFIPDTRFNQMIRAYTQAVEDSHVVPLGTTSLPGESYRTVSIACTPDYTVKDIPGLAYSQALEHISFILNPSSQQKVLPVASLKIEHLSEESDGIRRPLSDIESIKEEAPPTIDGTLPTFKRYQLETITDPAKQRTYTFDCPFIRPGGYPDRIFYTCQADQ